MQLIINQQNFTDNSQEANKNSIFVYNKQNENFIQNAKDNLAKDIISSSALAKYVDFTSIKIIGITGTNGKTTTAAAIYSILLDLGYKVALQGTRGLFINDKRVQEYSLTTPVQLANFSNIQEAIFNKCDFFVMEVSSHALAQNRIEGLNFELKILTNITRDHLDYHHTIEEYIKVKNSFFADDSKKLINKDEEKAKFNIKNAFSYGLDNPSTYKVKAYSLKNGIHIALSHFDNIVDFSSSMMGLFNVYNLSAAIACVDICTNKSLDDICEAVENFAGVSGRMEIISDKPLIIVDFAHTPHGMEEVYKSFNHKDIITVFGAGGDRDKNKRSIMGKVASIYAKKIILTSDNPRFEDPDLIIKDILKGIQDSSNVIVEINRKEAIKQAISLATPNCVILILGKGDEEYQIIYDKKFPLVDKNIIKDVLSSK